jgi:hypothetical protein
MERIINLMVSAMLNAGVKNDKRIMAKVQAYADNVKTMSGGDLQEWQDHLDRFCPYWFIVYRDGRFYSEKLSARLIDKREATLQTIAERILTKRIIKRHASLKMLRAFWSLSIRYSEGGDNVFDSIRKKETAKIYMSYFNQTCTRNNINRHRAINIMQRLDSRR